VQLRIIRSRHKKIGQENGLATRIGCFLSEQLVGDAKLFSELR
jgi:hypothetical protein